MYKFALLIFLPSLANAFQTEVQGRYNSIELDLNSNITSYLGAVNYYFEDLNYDEIPYKEVGFVSRVSSISFAFGSSNFDLSPGLGSSTNGTIYGLGGGYYQGNYFLSADMLMLEIYSDVLVSDITNTIISITPGYYFEKNSMIALRYENTKISSSLDDQVGTGYGIGYKALVNNINVELTYLQSDFDSADGLSKINMAETELLVEYYLNSSMYLGMSYREDSGDLTDNDGSAVMLSTGGLMSNNINYMIEYSEYNPKVGGKETSITVGAGISF